MKGIGMPSDMARGELQIDPALLERLSGLELRSRFLVRGLFASRHRTSDFGSSTEFIEHRAYRWGDELRTIDWRVFGRTDRFYVKVHEMEATMPIHLVLDTSASMRVPPESGRLGKFALAQVVAGAIATMAVWQQDAVGLFTVGDAVDTQMPPRQGDLHLSQVLRGLANPPLGTGGAFGERLMDVGARAGSRGMMFVLTDALDDVNLLGRALRTLRGRLQDVTLIRIFDRRELDFPYDRMTEFRQPETGERVFADPHTVRRHYLERLNAHREAVAATCRKAETTLLELDTASDLAALLSLHFIRRLMREDAA